MADVTISPDSDAGAAVLQLRVLVERAASLHQQGSVADALALATQARLLAVRDDLPVSADTGWLLNSLGMVFSENNYNHQARQIYERALAMSARLETSDDELVASVANNLGQVEARAGNFEGAAALLERAVRLREHGETKELALAFCVDNLGGVYSSLGDLDRADTMHRRALAIFERHGGLFDRHVATALGNLSFIYLRRRDFATAEAYRLRACDAHERTLGPTHPETLLDIRSLAEIYRAQGDTARADHFVSLLLSVGQGMAVETQRSLAEMLDSLAQEGLQDFQLDLAERLGARSLELLTAIDGPDTPDTLGAVHRFGRIQYATGDLESAQKSLQMALHGYGALNRDDDAAKVMVDLGKVYREWRQFPLAVEMFNTAVTLLRRDPASDRLDLASALGNLAQLHYDREELDLADATYAQALATLEPGRGDGERAWLLHNQAMLRYHRGRFDEARPLYEEAKRLWADAFGDDHPFVATTFANLALLYWATSDVPGALDAFKQMSALRDREMRRVLMVGNERKRAAYARGLQSDVHKVVSFLFQTGGARGDVARFAAELLLQRKGRVLDAVASTFSRLHESVDAEERRMFERLHAIRSQVAELVAPTLVLRAPLAERDRLAALRQEEERLEAALSYRTAADQPGLEVVSLEAVQRAIPADAALVDLLKFSVFDPVRTASGGVPWREARYAALVLTQVGEPRWFDLGPATSIEASVDRLRSALRRRSSTAQDWEVEASALYSLLVEPLDNALGPARRLLVSPDGKVTLLPLGVLRDPKGLPLSSRCSVSYLSAGRDVMRSGAGTTPARSVVVVAAPDYEAVVADSVAGVIDRFADRGAFGPLAGTREEGEDLAALLEGVTLLMGAEATVDAIAGVHHPAVLHVATHGVFNPLRELELHWTTDLLRIGDEAMFLSQSAPVVQNPMFFSGLALAGANRRGSGIITAQEIAALDLQGTELVVLSACETGLGTVKDGEEFTGLRRALAIAGAATQVTSLWRVDDEATRTLMGHYYRLLLDGQGRAEALASAQLRIANDATHPEWQHPFYWAAFVSAGDWGPMGDSLTRRQ